MKNFDEDVVYQVKWHLRDLTRCLEKMTQLIEFDENGMDFEGMDKMIHISSEVRRLQDFTEVYFKGLEHKIYDLWQDCRKKGE